MKGVAHVAGGEVRAKLRGLGASVLCASAGSGDAAGAECPLQQETETLVRARRTEVERNHTFDHLQEEGEEQERSLPATPVRSPSSFPPTPVPSPSLQIDEADAQRGIDETRPGQEGGTSRGECEEVAARFPEYSDDLATPACAGAAQGEGGCTALERDETAFLRGWVNPAPEPSMGAMSNCDTDSCRSSPVTLSHACSCLAHASAFGAELLLLSEPLPRVCVYATHTRVYYARVGWALPRTR